MLPASTNLVMSGSGGFDLNGTSQTVASLSSSATTTQLILSSGGVLTTNGNASTTFAGSISGNGGLVKAGTGTLGLTGSNNGNFLGSTTINAGTLQATNGSSLGSGLLTLNNGTFQASGSFGMSGPVSLGNANSTISVDPAQVLTLTGSIGGGGALNKTGPGVLALANTASYPGPTNISGGTLQIGNAVASMTGTGVFNHVTEAQGYKLVYQLNIPTASNYASTAPTYAVDNSASIAAGSFNRIGYYMELKTASSQLYYMYVSFDASPFATAANKLGVPTVASGEFYHYAGSGGSIQNMDIVTNAPGISGLTYSGSIGTATNLSSGLAQFWPGNYGNTNGYGVPNAPNVGTWNTGTGDDGGGTGTGYGSMKFGSDGVGGGPNGMLMSFDNWGGNGGNNCVGIGNGDTVASWFSGVTNTNRDYTFSQNAASYTLEDLQVVVGNGLGGGHGQLPAVSPVSVTNGSTLDLNHSAQTVASLSGDALSTVALGGGTLTIGGGTSSTNFAGIIADAGGATPSYGGCLVVLGGTQVLSGTNSSYSGGTTISNALLAVASLAVGGSNSSIGASTSNAGNLVIDGGTLQYIGSGASSTDRLFKIGSTTGNATIDASGSGPLTFSNTGALAFAASNSNNTITLAGSSTAANAFALVIHDPATSGHTSLVKNGPGAGR